MNLNEPTLVWGVATTSTAITNSLFTDETFTFKKGAEAFIENAGESIEVRDLLPVLLRVRYELCDDVQADALDVKQVAWLQARALKVRSVSPR